MTKAQAQLAFVKGKKISHKTFLDGEFVELNEANMMIDETGLILDKLDFWLARSKGDLFANGWFVIEG